MSVIVSPPPRPQPTTGSFMTWKIPENLQLELVQWLGRRISRPPFEALHVPRPRSRFSSPGFHHVAPAARPLRSPPILFSVAQPGALSVPRVGQCHQGRARCPSRSRIVDLGGTLKRRISSCVNIKQTHEFGGRFASRCRRGALYIDSSLPWAATEEVWEPPRDTRILVPRRLSTHPCVLETEQVASASGRLVSVRGN